MAQTKDELRREIGRTIRERRLELNMTQDQFADKVGLSYEHCVQVENGNKGLSILSLQKVAEVLGVSMDYLVCGRTEKTEYENILRLLDELPLSQLHRVEQVVALFVETWKNREG